MSLAEPPPTEGRGPTLSTMHEVERILRNADQALSLNEIKRRMSAKAVAHHTVRTVVDEHKRLGLAAEGSEGVVWTLTTDTDAWGKARGERLA